MNSEEYLESLENLDKENEKLAAKNLAVTSRLEETLKIARHLCMDKANEEAEKLIELNIGAIQINRKLNKKLAKMEAEAAARDTCEIKCKPKHM